jgi:hypothetical protein
MSIFNKIKKVGIKANNTVSANYKKQKQQFSERKDARMQKYAEQDAENIKKAEIEKAKKAKAAVIEKARQEAILKGEIAPINVIMNLKLNEKAYVQIPSERMAAVDNIIQHTVGSGKKKNIVGRAIVGGVLLGGVGALAGAATAGTKNESTTTQKTVSTVQNIDTGKLILTNQRFIFMGEKNIVSLKYEEILSASFDTNMVVIKYPGMLNQEYYRLSADSVSNTQLYYTGITQHLISS